MTSATLSPIMPDEANRRDPAFQANRRASLARLQILRERLELVRQGDERSVTRHRSRGKLTARQRITRLSDDATAFLEVGALAAWGEYDGEVPSAGIVTGVGLVSDRPCMVLANDATVKGGTYYPLTVKKHLRAQEIAEQNRLPCIYLVDSGGANLPHQAEVFPDRDHFGRIFYNQARMSAMGIPQLSAVMGSSTAGGAYIPAMSDETTIVDGVGTVFLGGPPLVKAATGEVIDAESLGGGWVHATISGVVDHLAASDDEALDYLRSAVARIPYRTSSEVAEHEAPLFDPEEIHGLIPADPAAVTGIRGIIARIVDGSRFHEFKAGFGETLICGFATIAGMEVGIIANNGILFSESAQKGTHFVELASARGVPLIFLQNINGFMVGKDYEHGGIAKHGAKMVMAVACTNVPKITVVIGGSFGAGNYAMAGRAYSPRFLWQWPNARISVMGGEQAAMVMTSVGRADRPDEEREEQARTIREKFDHESDAYYSTAHLWDDGIIDPARTRDVLIMSLLTARQSPMEPTQFGVFRM